MGDVSLIRVPLSLPCEVPVTPDTASTDAPVEERTDCCRTDAWWLIGRALICDRHLREVMGERYDAMAEGVTLNDRELLPWPEAPRYEHAAPSAHQDYHPHFSLDSVTPIR